MPFYILSQEMKLLGSKDGLVFGHCIKWLETTLKIWQSDSEMFSSLTRGDDSLCYMHCVFKDHPSIEVVLRSTARHARGESGVEEITRTRSTIPPDTHSGRNIRHG